MQSENNKGVCSFPQTMGPRVGMVLVVGKVGGGGVEEEGHSRGQRMS